MLYSRLKTSKKFAGPLSPTSHVTAQLFSRRWRVFWSCYNADCQQRSNERLVVLPQTRSSSFHGLENISGLDGMKLFKNIQIYCWAVLPQARPSSIHSVKKSFRLMLCRVSTTFKWTVGRATPYTIQLILLVEGFVRMDGMDFFKNDQISGWAVFFFQHGTVLFTVLKNFFV